MKTDFRSVGVAVLGVCGR